MQQDNTTHVLKCDLGDARTNELLVAESDLLDSLRHPNVVSLYRVLNLGWPSRESDLLHARLSSWEMRACFEQMQSALLYCHAQGVHAMTKSSIVLTWRLRS